MKTRRANWDHYEPIRRVVANSICSQCGAPALRSRVSGEVLVICLRHRQPCATIKFQTQDILDLIEDFNHQRGNAPSPLDARLDEIQRDLDWLSDGESLMQTRSLVGV